MNRLARWWSGERLEDKLLRQLDLQARQASEDRRAFRDMLLEQQAFTERQHKSTTDVVTTIAASVMKQAESFNRYLDMATPKGEPVVRQMNDAIEAKMEKDYMASRPDADEFAALGLPVYSPLEEQLAHADAMTMDIHELTRSLAS